MELAESKSTAEGESASAFFLLLPLMPTSTATDAATAPCLRLSRHTHLGPSIMSYCFERLRFTHSFAC